MTLKTDMIADLDNVFFNTDEFAVAAIYTPTGGTATSIKVLFHDEYDELSGVENYRYWIEAKTSDMPAAKIDEPIVIEGITYKIKEPPHHTDDGTSIIELKID
jgi:hypothetical protein